MSIIELLKQDGFDPVKKTDRDGGEYSSPCPWCGGDDRFCIWPAQGRGGRYWCRQCGKKGDAVRYLQDSRGFSSSQARKFLGVEGKRKRKRAENAESTSSRRADKGSRSPRREKEPGVRWKERAESLVYWAEDQLWNNSARAERMLKWLRDERGLTRETIRNARLGCLPENLFRSREQWGLATEMSDKTGEPKKLFIPSGLVIPCRIGGAVVRVRIRRSDPGERPRYHNLCGSRMHPLCISVCEDKPAIIVESDLDAFLLAQEAGGRVGAISLGSASKRPDEETTKVLRNVPVILVALDSDEAGARQSVDWWQANFRQYQRCLVPKQFGKDPTEAWKSGLSLDQWVKVGLDMARDNVATYRPAA